MKQLFIPAKIKQELDVKKIQSFHLPINIAIAYSIQYKEIALKIKTILSKTHKIIAFVQVLGCSKPKFSRDTKAILLVSSGKFHAVSLALESNLPVYLFNGSNLEKISENEINQLKAKKKTGYMKFLNSDKIGIIVSLKPGQENLKKALSLKSSLKTKKSYLFLSNEINPKEFENFSIESWVNTACPRLDFDSPAINISDLIFLRHKNSLINLYFAK
jgi:diphthamide biosynthesis enzyme Dph1/Dph2-like protein